MSPVILGGGGGGGHPRRICPPALHHPPYMSPLLDERRMSVLRAGVNARVP